jgi:UDP-glucose 4-epimerase
MTTVLLTGGAGYIGSHCCKALAERGYLPVVFDDLSAGHREFVRWGPLFEGDVRDPAALHEVFEIYRPQAVMHFAALVSVEQSIREPMLYKQVNFGGTKNLLNAMAEFGVGKIVFSSTAAVYGDTDHSPIDEMAALSPTNPYSETKLSSERLIVAFCRQPGHGAVVLRYFNAAGAAGAAEIGEYHRPETHLIPLVLDAAMGRRGEIMVFGGDYPTADGSAVRDYVHVCDLADAHVIALEHLLGGGDTLTCNLGTGTGRSVLEVIRTAEAVVKQPIAYRMAPRRPGDLHRLVAANDYAMKTLGWVPKKPILETMIHDAWRRHQTRFS